MGSVSRNIPNFAFTKKPNVFFDPLKYNWIGSPEMTNRGCFARPDSGVKTAEDLFERELLVGGDGAGTSLSEMPTLLKNLLGMKFKTIDGYQGSNGVVLAIARNEVSGICQTVTAFAQSAQNMLDDGTVRLLFTTEKKIGCHHNKVRTVLNLPRPREQREHPTRVPTLEPGDRPTLAGAPRGAARPGQRLAPGLRCHHEGSGVPLDEKASSAIDTSIREPANRSKAVLRSDRGCCLRT